MKFHLLRCFLVVAVILLTSVSYAQMPQGWWLFDNALDLTAAVPGYGSDLELTGSQTAVAGPSVGNGAISIDVGSYYKLTHGFAPNGGGTKVNEYTLMFDFKVANLNKWHTFFQTDMNVVGSDGDYFKNTSGMLGTWALNYSTTPIAVDTWYRLVISIDNGNFFKTYLDGALLQTHVPQAIDDRWSLDSYFYLFGDDDGDDGLIEIAEVAIWNYALTPTEVLNLYEKDFYSVDNCRALDQPNKTAFNLSPVSANSKSIIPNGVASVFRFAPWICRIKKNKAASEPNTISLVFIP